MVVLTRKVGETIILDDGIEITLMDIQGNHIRINRPDPNASKLRMFSSVGCAVRTKIPACRYFYGAHGAPYYDT